MEMEFDEEDTALIAIVGLSAAVMAGLGTFSAFGVSLSDTFSLVGTSFSLAYGITVGAFILTVWTNDHDLDPREFSDSARDNLDESYYWMLMGSLAILVLWPFIPEIQSFVKSQDLWGVIFIAGSVGAQLAIGYMR